MTHLCHSPSHKTQEIIVGWGGGKTLRSEFVENSCKKKFFLDMTEMVHLRLYNGYAVAVCPRPAQDQVGQNSK